MNRKTLAIILAALIAAIAVPATSHGLSVTCELEQLRAVKACPKKKGKRPSATCKKRTKQLNQCLEAAANQTDPDSFCITLYSPVCAVIGGGKAETYPNSCFATLAGASILARGECPTGF